MAYPTGPMHGKCAKVLYDGTVIDHSSRWSINWTKDAAVYGRQGQEYKEARPGQAGWTGTAEFIFVRSSEQKSAQTLAVSTESTVTLTTGVSSVIKFCFDTTANRLQGQYVVTGLTFDAPVGDLVRCSMTFQGSGPLEFTS